MPLKRAPQRRTFDPSKPFFCFNEILMLVPALTNGPDFRHSRVASGYLAEITPTQPSPIEGEGFRTFGTCEFELAFLARFCNCIFKMPLADPVTCHPGSRLRFCRRLLRRMGDLLTRSVDVVTVRRWLAHGGEIAFLDVREEGHHGSGPAQIAADGLSGFRLAAP
jgi:hypothetical protein